MTQRSSSIIEEFKPEPRFVQYGCGINAPDVWINFDASPTLRLQNIPLVGPLITRGRARFPASVRYGDVVRGLPITTGSVMEYMHPMYWNTLH